MKTLLRGAWMFDGRSLQRMDILIDRGRVVQRAKAISPESFYQVFDFKDCLILPGLVDVHVHLREPGFSFKETIRTGTRAAARGGYTEVFAMPNLKPPPDTRAHLEVQLSLIRENAVIPVHPYATITQGQTGHAPLSDFSTLADICAGFSDDGRGVQSESLMREAMVEIHKLGGIVVAHCEDERYLDGGYIHAGRYAQAHGHAGISSGSEWRMVARDLRLAEETGCRYHVCHVSTKESVQLIREAKARGIDVTCETAPHYLILSDDDLQEDGRFKMNPPLRAAEDRDALVAALVDGTIDMIATDHAPHAAQEKDKGLKDSLMGVVGLECAFPALYTKLVLTQKVPLARLYDAMCVSPRARMGLQKNTLDVGDAADLAVFDLSTEEEINPDTFLSLGKATPFQGMRVRGWNRMTIKGGETIWSRE